MGFFANLFSRKSAAPSIALMEGDGEYVFDIVGESSYQAELESIAGSKTEQGYNHRCTAALFPEPENKYDRNAIRVVIDKKTVGYMARDDAKTFRNTLLKHGYELALSRAEIVGGWSRKGGDTGHYGVKLDVELPFTLSDAPK